MSFLTDSHARLLKPGPSATLTSKNFWWTSTIAEKQWKWQGLVKFLFLLLVLQELAAPGNNQLTISGKDLSVASMVTKLENKRAANLLGCVKESRGLLILGFQQKHDIPIIPTWRLWTFPLKAMIWRAYEHDEEEALHWALSRKLWLGNHYEYEEEKLCNVLFHETLNPKPWRAYEHEERSFALRFSKKAMTWRALWAWRREALQCAFPWKWKP